MKNIWWRIAGYTKVRILCAEPENLLGTLACHMQVREISWISALSFSCMIPRWAQRKFEELADRCGAKWEIVGRYGLPCKMKQAWGSPVIVCFMMLLFLLTIYVPSRILFIQVSGNEEISQQQILSAASEAGLSFGSSRRALRSEEIKNKLLSSIPSLSWVGVNTQGCVATISVQERKLEPSEQELIPGDIVASQDAVVRSFTVTRGRPVCQNGQAVQEGDVLISGYLDLGICTRAERADGEVYGLTRREAEAVLPDQTMIYLEETVIDTKYSILLGKKRINLHSDSGILYPTCGKMTKEKVLTLPGGWELPVSLVTEVYTAYTMTQGHRTEKEALDMLYDCARRQTRQALVAGEILDQELSFLHDAGRYCLSGTFQCHEMIGKRSCGVIFEGDTNDDGKNS